ncbi:MAG: Gfo/Idh/MocA family oxidoreductase [Fimbriimonadaceae bacterium]|nr:Gfo/Idh/MocA family oxidoreductase [Fimbriimonadaceae bacterium]
MADSLRWGILATGSIARQFAGGLRVSKTGRLVTVGSRSLENAERFCSEFGGRAAGSYEEVLADPEVDAVYIATPHHLHMANTISAARAGKAILCEKPFTLNLREAELALAAVKEAGVFFMEAFMYRCHPQTRRLVELLRENAIGRMLQINAEFGFAAGRDWTNFRADGAVGGGGLMDVGTYCVSFSRLVAGLEPSAAYYVAEITERGYDASGAGVLKFPNDIVAHFGTGIHVSLRNDATVYGEQGRIHIANPWKCASGGITLERNGASEFIPFGSTNDELYAYEADAVAQYLDQKECPYMTLQDTLGNARTLDMLRASAGLTFAAETR